LYFGEKVGSLGRGPPSPESGQFNNRSRFLFGSDATDVEFNGVRTNPVQGIGAFYDVPIYRRINGTDSISIALGLRDGIDMNISSQLVRGQTANPFRPCKPASK
jgi:hypothetical protein